MKKLIALSFGLALLWTASFNFEGCSSNNATSAPTTVVEVPPTATPVCASPTIYGAPTTLSATNNSINYMDAQCVTLVGAETVTSVSFYAGVTAVGQIRFAIYGGTTSAPGNLIYQTNPQNAVPLSVNTAAIPAIYLPAGAYWVALQYTNILSIPSVAGGNLAQATYTYGTFPSTYPSTSIYSINYGLYMDACP